MPKTILFLSIVFLSACSHISEQQVQGRWIVSDMMDIPTLTQRTPWLYFNDGEVEGHSGCNAFIGSYQLDRKLISFSTLASTRRLCLGPEMEQERALFKLLSLQLTITQENSYLLMLLDTRTVLRLETEEGFRQAHD